MNLRKGNMIIDCLSRGQARVNIAPTLTDSALFTTLATLQLTTQGEVLVGFYTSITHASGGLAYFDLALDGIPVGDEFEGLLKIIAGSSGSPTSVSLTLRLERVSPGAHTLTLLWRTDEGILEAGHGQFWAVEG